MIPKIIHYVWLGGKALPPLEKKCITSWIKHNPDFKIQRWDENNLSIDDPVYLKAYQKKQWAYCSDYARLKVLHAHGGIYLDTDIEIIKSLDDLLTSKCFLGRENPNDLNGAVIGAIKGHPFIFDVFKATKESLKSDFVPIPRILNFVYNYEKYPDVMIYPEKYFYPYNPFYKDIKLLLFCDIEDDTYAIHHWNYSWKPTLTKRVVRIIKRIITKSPYFDYKEKIK